MNYSVLPIAANALPDRLEAARKKYCEVIDAASGDPGQVAISYRASEKRKQGGEPMLPGEQASADKWDTADKAARSAAMPEFGDDAINQDFLILLP